MGQIQVKNADNSSINKIKAPSFVEAQISFSDYSVIRPNGFFPPEIIVLILKYTDIVTYARSSGTCKLWYEIIKEELRNMYISRYGTLESLEDNWKAHFYRRTFCDRNLACGKWWAEAITSHNYIVLAEGTLRFSYIASFEGNKIIVNTHTASQKTEIKISEAAYVVDLDTMKREPMPYGTIFANGFKIKIRNNDDYYFDWREFEVDDGTTKRIIKRKYQIPKYEDSHRAYHSIFANRDGSPTLLTVNEHPYMYNRDIERYFRQVEIVDLRTGEIIHEFNMRARYIITFIGDTIIYNCEKDIYIMNIHTKEQKLWNSLGTKFYYCKDTNIIGQATESGSVILYNWPSLEIVSQIPVNTGKLEPPDENTSGHHTMIASIVFDKSKLVVLTGAHKAKFYAVFDMKTKELSQTLYNTTDEEQYVQSNIYLAPNSKIVTDCGNLTVYDFTSPMLYKSIPVIYAEYNSAEVTKLSVPAESLSSFVAWKLNVSLHVLQHATFFATTKNGQQYRVTGIGSYNRERDGEVPGDWQQLSEYMDHWTNKEEVRNTFQITKSNGVYPITFDNSGIYICWRKLRKVILVYERFNEATNEWEFTAPIGLEELAEQSDEEL